MCTIVMWYCDEIKNLEIEIVIILGNRTNKIKGRVLAMLSEDDLIQYLLHIFKNSKESAQVYKQTIFFINYIIVFDLSE